ncbi:MAG: N-acetylmuramoyl-L-alanine amidase [Acidobacteriia bacterium]|nr:N-acetylmuramoyl-L-alanine amidase [Terriglobia bacterium]
MSANPNNAGLELVHETVTLTAAPRPTTQPGSGREALQALLAFSALHEQIRHRRALESKGDDHLSAEDSWQLEQFVLDEVLHLVAERALAITGADGVAIALADGDAIVCRASAGGIAPDPGARLDPNSGFSGACLVSGRIVRCDDSEVDPRVNPQTCRILGARSMVAVPLSAKQTVIGLLEAFSTEPYGFNDSDVRSLNLLAELILSALRPEEEDRLAEISQRVVSRAIGPEANGGISPPQDQPHDRILDQPRQAGDAEPTGQPATVPEYDGLANSRPGLVMVLALLLFALALGAGLWWSIRRHASSRTSAPQAVAPTSSTAPASPAALLPGLEEEEQALPAPAATTNGMPEVTGIRHWSSADSSTVVIDLQDQVQYEAHRLSNPERIYFDLHDTRLAAQLSNRIIAVGDSLLQRIRVAQPVRGVTRVVLETKGASNFSVSLEPNPYRLVVEVRKLGAPAQPRAKVDLFGPADSSLPTEEAATRMPQPSIPSQPTGLAASAARPGSTGTASTHVPEFRIALDAGHGGWDLGTVGRKGLLEKDLVLDIVKRLGKLVENRLGAEVIYTRNNDDYVALEKRAEVANLAKANLFLSVHANYSDYPSARGVETYYTNTYSSVRARTREADAARSLQDVDWTKVDIREKVHESRLLAASVQRALYGTLAAKNPGLSNRGVKKAQYVVLTGTSMPAILAEVSFVSSPTDENNLQSSNYRQRIAEALYQGLARYEESSRVKIASASGRPAGR